MSFAAGAPSKEFTPTDKERMRQCLVVTTVKKDFARISLKECEVYLLNSLDYGGFFSVRFKVSPTLRESYIGDIPTLRKSYIGDIPTLRESNLGDIPTLQESYISDIPTLRESYIGDIPTLRESYIGDIPTLRESYIGDIPTLQESYIGDIPTLQESYISDIPTLRESYIGDIPTLRESYIGDIPTLRESYIVDIPTLQESFIGDIPTLRESYIGDIPTLRESYIGDIPTLQESYIGDIPTLQESYISDIPTLQESYISDIPTLRESYIGDIPTLRESYIGDIPTLRESYISDIPTLQVSYIGDIPTLQESYISDIPTLRESYIGDIPTLRESYIGDIPTLRELYIGDIPTLQESFIGDIPTLRESYIGDIPTLQESYIGNIRPSIDTPTRPVIRVYWATAKVTRRSHIEATCQAYSTNMSKMAMMTSKWLVSRRHQFLYCPVEKVASTFWRRFLHQLEYTSPMKVANRLFVRVAYRLFVRVANRLFVRLANILFVRVANRLFVRVANSLFVRVANRLFVRVAYGLFVRSPFDVDAHRMYATTDNNTAVHEAGDKLTQLLMTSTKLVFVRDPYSRLFSAYVGKLLFLNPIFWNVWGLYARHAERGGGRRGARNDVLPWGPCWLSAPLLYAVKTFRQTTALAEKASEDTCGDDVTFREFVSLATSARGELDHHVMSINRLCSPCLVNYTIIGKMETFLRDTRLLLHRLGVDEGHVELGRMQDDVRRDAVEDSVHDPMSESWLNRTLKCVSKADVVRSIWRKLQIRGFIS
ncbi:hypothetical protein Btru_064460 [Bulinus truncatus]|nr:hypothetical protein Btru_064460 [Bulinus truncatus]